MKGLLAFFSCVLLGSTLTAQAAEPDHVVAPTSVIVVSQCGKTVAMIIVDENGVARGVPPEAMTDGLIDRTVSSVDEKHRLGLVVKCVKADTVI